MLWPPCLNPFCRYREATEIHTVPKETNMTLITAFARACRSAFAGSDLNISKSALTDRTETELLRSGTSSAAILHHTVSGLYYS